MQKRRKQMKVIKVYADWCGPCRELEKLLKECNIEHESVNIDSMDGEGLSLKYNIKSLPTLLVTDDEGNLLRKLSGMVPKEKLVKFIYQ